MTSACRGWTSRGKFRPGRYATVGVAPAGGAAELAVPVPSRARRYVLTAAVGQEGGRLRVHRLRLGLPVTRRREARFSLPPRAEDPVNPLPAG